MKNVYILMIIQALLTLLLFFSEGYVKYTTIGLFLLMDLILFASLLKKRWDVVELLIFTAIFCSGVFMLFYVFMMSTLTIVFGVAVMLLFLVIAMIDYISKPINQTRSYSNKFEKLQMPEAPAYYYNVEYDSTDSSNSSNLKTDFNTVNINTVNTTNTLNTFKTRPEPVMHVRSEAKPSEVKNKLTAKAVAYELEREAMQLKNAEKMMQDLKIYDAEKELLKETKAMQDAQKQIDIANTAAKKEQAAKQLKKEAAEILRVQKQINDINKINALEKEVKSLNKAQKQINTVNKITGSNKITALENEVKSLNKAQKQINNIQKTKDDAKKITALEKEVKSLNKAQKQINGINTGISRINALEKEAKSLKKADKQVREMQFLNQQEKIVKQAKEIAKAQKEIDAMNKDTKKSMTTIPKQAAKPTKIKEIVRVKTVKAKDESFYFATEDGNKFHEPGCLAIKKVPKNKLVLYTNKKDAMKKGLQPCSICIPK